IKTPPPVKDEKLLFTVIRAAFNQRRKTLLNCLRNTKELSLTRERAADILRVCGFDENIRGENLSTDDFIKLSDALTP
ncbi:MAG: 16S rRNA (adenine(1518)-N(6)/adenine(1519)-N(6))-dimethyltransferase, partial [Clostridiales bacterium]|nr:16S rRNA (adenine(1518)-N(6)/adenine(1519)-N(6))-dimethyltransferase [Clostridiales bacterium]